MTDISIPPELRDVALEDAVLLLTRGKNLASVAMTLTVIAATAAKYAGIPQDVYTRTCGFLWECVPPLPVAGDA